jgi:hypothetical protein
LALKSAPYNFIGFLAPIANPPMVNSGKAGQTYPIKWQLKDSTGAYVSALTAVQSINFQNPPCTDFTGISNTLPAASSGDSSLRYDSTANQYVFNWSTPRQAPGCYVLTVTFDTGKSFSTDFNLR